MNSFFNSAESAAASELNDYYVNRLMLTVLTCISKNCIAWSIVAKNAVEFDFEYDSVLRLEKNKNGFTLYAKSDVMPNFTYDFVNTSIPELLFASVFGKVRVFMF